MTPAPLPPVMLTCPKCSETFETRAKAGSTIRCPRNRRSRGRDCTGVAYVPKARPVTAITAGPLSANLAQGWESEPAGVLDWRAQLGPECPGAAPCDDTCDCGGPPIVYTADHTGTACPGCGPDCWQPTPGAFDRGRAHAKTTAAARTARTPAAQAELDARARDLERERARLLRAVNAAQTVKRITADSVSDLRWFAAAIEQAGTPARLQQLAADLDGYYVAELDDDSEAWDDDDDDQADDYDDGPAPSAELRQLYRPAPAQVLPFVMPRAPGWTDAQYQREIARRIAQQQGAR